ncbi:MAG: flagellar biosynthesis protein FlhF [Lachnospiraceae bacterium]|nr:flagellar biosynthesis protein FlhF [Lachnospiraceae bacterium]
MIVKKFEAATENEAILKAKEELGASAVVLSVKTMKQRGFMRLFKKDKVEITAALEEKDYVAEVNERKPTVNSSKEKGNTGEESSKSGPKAKETSKQSGGKENVRDSLGNSTSSSKHVNMAADEQIDPSKMSDEEFEKKIDTLSELLKKQLQSQKEGSTRNNSGIVRTINSDLKKEQEEKEAKTLTKEQEERAKAEANNLKALKLIYNKLIDNEVDETYANALVNEIESSLKKESNIDSILAGVYQKIILKLGEPSTIELSEHQKIIFFVGPTGVGKTTTIAKLASKFKLNEHKKVAFITSDTYRIAAVEQLNTYAGILDVPIRVVYTEEELKKALDEFKDYDLVLVDTAGRSHKNAEQRDEIIELYRSVSNMDRPVDTEAFLVLSVTTKYRDLVSITKAYEKLGDYKLLFTKLDETSTLGNIYNIRLMTGASLSYTTAGQNVPDDIETINVQKLAKQVLGGNV